MVASVSVLLYCSLFINLMYSYPKVKNYYKSKLAFYKNPKNLRYRQIHGKYPCFSLPNHSNLYIFRWLCTA